MTRAIVIGASLGGLSAARVLADFFDEVVLLERDELPLAAESRAGVPQSKHVHVLLERGRDELEALFPGFTAAMLEGGAGLFDPGLHVATRRKLGWQDVGANGYELLWSSRALLESTVRRLLREQTRVRLQEQTQVVGLSQRRSPQRRVDGVKVRDRKSQEESTLQADFVVDASGRSTRSDSWLLELGLRPPDCERVDVHAGYASRFYEPPRDRPKSWWWKGLWLEWQPPTLPRGGVVFPLEGNRWMVTVAGIREDIPPTDERGFNAFLRRLSSPVLAEAVARATPISGIVGSRSFANVFRRYDEWSERLPGFIAVGDASCAFNPIYGQGMSAAAVSASLLRTTLRELGPAHPELARRFFARQGKFVRGLWALATRADFAWPTTEGKRPASLPLVGSYVRLALEATHCSAELRRHVGPLFNLTSSSALLFEPEFVGKVLLFTAKKQLRERLLGVSAIADMPPRPGSQLRSATSASGSEAGEA